MHHSAADNAWSSSAPPSRPLLPSRCFAGSLRPITVRSALQEARWGGQPNKCASPTERSEERCSRAAWAWPTKEQPLDSSPRIRASRKRCQTELAAEGECRQFWKQARKRSRQKTQQDSANQFQGFQQTIQPGRLRHDPSIDKIPVNRRPRFPHLGRNGPNSTEPWRQRLFCFASQFPTSCHWPFGARRTLPDLFHAPDI
jgi:hypothetical protein